MPKRFHSEPMVLATELLLQERLPVIYEQQGSEVDLAPAGHLESEEARGLDPVMGRVK